MHLRGEPVTLTDTLHILFTAFAVGLMLGAIFFAARGLTRSFRRYSAYTALSMPFFGALTGLQAPRIAENLPTPWMGITERLSVFAFLLQLHQLPFFIA